MKFKVLNDYYDSEKRCIIKRGTTIQLEDTNRIGKLKRNKLISEIKTKAQAK